MVSGKPDWNQLQMGAIQLPMQQPSLPIPLPASRAESVAAGTFANRCCCSCGWVTAECVGCLEAWLLPAASSGASPLCTWQGG